MVFNFLSYLNRLANLIIQTGLTVYNFTFVPLDDILSSSDNFFISIFYDLIKNADWYSVLGSYSIGTLIFGTFILTIIIINIVTWLFPTRSIVSM